MQDDGSNTVSSKDRQESVPWSVADLKKMERFAPRRCSLIELQQAFPDRTFGAIKTKLYQTRDRMGIEQNARSGAGPRKPPKLTLLRQEDPGCDDLAYRRRVREAAEGDALMVEALRRAGFAR